MMSANMEHYFKPIKVGKNELSSRIVMAPLTRLRNNKNLSPQQPSVDHYAQRSDKGSLVVTEGVYISPQTVALHQAPGIWTSEHVESWKKVVDAVHAKGGFISCQLWHVGRHAHESFSQHPAVKDTGYSTGWGPSAVAAPGYIIDIDNNYVPAHIPKEYTIEMIQELRRDYIKAAKNAMEAGFDYVELHSAHGYLPQQFFSTSSNTRTDEYGGSLENRFRFLNEVLNDLIETVGREKVGIRVSPHNNDDELFVCPDENPEETFSYCMKVLNNHKLAYVLFSEPRWNPSEHVEDTRDNNLDFPATNGVKYGSLLRDTIVMGAGGFTPISGHNCLEYKAYDIISFGRWFIANPDLVYRIRNGFPLNRYDRNSFYNAYDFELHDMNSGYTDYPSFNDVLQHLGYTLEQAKDEEIIVEIIAKSQSMKYPLIALRNLGNKTSLSQLTEESKTTEA